MDIERIDWWEKERPPFKWIDYVEWHLFETLKRTPNKFITEEFINDEILRIRSSKDEPSERP